MPRALTDGQRGAIALVAAGVMLAAAGALYVAPSHAEGTRPRLYELESRLWSGFRLGNGQRSAVVALVPRRRAAGERFPMLVAMHGLGETWRGPQRGPWGWSQDYLLPRADHALRNAPLDPSDLEGLVEAPRLAALNRALREQAYRGLVVLMPFTPDVRAGLGGAEHQRFDRWLCDELVPRARRELPVLPARESTGIDGVSLGGLHALWTGLGHPETFGVVGALQPAVRGRQALVLDRRAQGASRPPQRVRVVTSTLDTLREDVVGLDSLMTQRGISHEFRLLTGPHDYVFNQGPGGVEMLLFHDRALRGLAAP